MNNKDFMKQDTGDKTNSLISILKKEGINDKNVLNRLLDIINIKLQYKIIGVDNLDFLNELDKELNKIIILSDKCAVVEELPFGKNNLTKRFIYHVKEVN